MTRLTVAIVFLLGAWAPSVAQVDADNEVEPTPWKEDAKVLACTPSSLGPGGTLVLTLGPGHGKELAIRSEADDVWYFLVVGSPPDDMKSLMTPKQFEAAVRVVVPANVTGYAWVANRGNEPVFGASGTYHVHTSDVLESEVAGYTCKVEFHAR